MSDVKKLNKDDLNKVTGGTEVCVFNNGKTFCFEMNHYYYSQDKKDIVKIVGQLIYYANFNHYLIPVEIYTLNKEFENYGHICVHDTDSPYEEVTNF